MASTYACPLACSWVKISAHARWISADNGQPDTRPGASVAALAQMLSPVLPSRPLAFLRHRPPPAVLRRCVALLPSNINREKAGAGEWLPSCVATRLERREGLREGEGRAGQAGERLRMLSCAAARLERRERLREGTGAAGRGSAVEDSGSHTLGVRKGCGGREAGLRGAVGRKDKARG